MKFLFIISIPLKFSLGNSLKTILAISMEIVSTMLTERPYENSEVIMSSFEKSFDSFFWNFHLFVKKCICQYLWTFFCNSVGHVLGNTIHNYIENFAYQVRIRLEISFSGFFRIYSIGNSFGNSIGFFFCVAFPLKNLPALSFDFSHFLLEFLRKILLQSHRKFLCLGKFWEITKATKGTTGRIYIEIVEIMF